MNKQPKMLIIMIIFAGLIIVGFIWASLHGKSSSKRSTSATQKHGLWDTAVGDTNNEVLRTVIANQQKLQKQNKQLKAENEQLNSKNKMTLQNKLQEANKKIQQKLFELKSTLESQINDVKNKPAHSDLNKANPYHIVGKGNQTHSHMIGNVPDLSQQFDPASSSDSLVSASHHHTAQSASSGLNNTALSMGSSQQSSAKKSVIPFYTIPAGATLNSVALMTSIIGEVPVSGHLVAPAFPFKAIIGRKDLFAANGLSLPVNVSGMVVEGYSVGNMTLSCARAYVTRVLFVFNDGHFVVYPKKSTNSAAQLYPKNALGYLSDVYGNTCITGKYITDAPKVIATMGLMGGVSAIGGAIEQAQYSTQISANQSASVFTGNLGKLAGGAMLNGAMEKSLNWYNKRVSDIFDAVFIPATSCNRYTHRTQVTHVVFNVTKTIPIDLNEKGRKLRYENYHQMSRWTNRLD